MLLLLLLEGCTQRVVSSDGMDKEASHDSWWTTDGIYPLGSALIRGRASRHPSHESAYVYGYRGVQLAEAASDVIGQYQGYRDGPA